MAGKQTRLSWVVAVLVYTAVVAGIVFFLLMRGEETLEKRQRMTPQASVDLSSKATVPLAVDDEADILTDDVPDSWKEDEAVDATETPPVTDPSVTDAAPKQDDKPAEAEKPKTEEPKADEQVETPVTLPVDEKAAAPADTASGTVEVNKLDEAAPAVTVDQNAQPAATDVNTDRWKQFARPFNTADKRPRIILVIADLGLARNATETAVQDLPSEITLAFSSLVPDLENWLAKGRAAGHEMVLTIPMEPVNYPQNDPGPNALLLTQDDAENVARLKRALDRAQGYVGIMPYMGEKFVTDEAKMTPVMQYVREQGLLVLDNSLSGASVIPPLARLGKMPFVRADLTVDAAAAIGSIDTQLQNLETIAKDKGVAVGVAMPYPVTFERLKAWIKTLEQKGIVLAPLSAAVTVSPAPVQVVK